MKLLHIGCHEILEYDELKLFTQLPGLEVFSPTAYKPPGANSLRPEPPCRKPKDKWLQLWAEVPNDPDLPPPHNDKKNHLTPELLAEFDAVYFQHMPFWIENNWAALQQWGGTVYYRDIGQALNPQELTLKKWAKDGLKIIRYSPKTRMHPNYAGEDAMIRFSKDPSEFVPWAGDRQRVITVSQNMKGRRQSCSYDTFIQSTINLEPLLFGKDNEDSVLTFGGEVSYSRLLEILSWYRCYFYTGTYPAPYTLNFMEAALSGISIVALSSYALELPYPHYEVPDLLRQWGVGAVGHDPVSLERAVTQTLTAPLDELRDLSEIQVKEASAMFGYDAVKPQWMELFGL